MVVAKKGNGDDTKAAPNKSTHNTEVWGKNNACVVCQVVCAADEDKVAHESLQTHIKKLNIYNFFSKEAANLASSDTPSALMRRYMINNEKAVGLECVHELRFPWAATGWWACSICYESGCHYEQADHHIRSMNHLSTYIEEFHPDKAAKISETDLPKRYEQLLQLRNQLFEEQGNKLLPPEILSMDLEKEEAAVKLVVSEPSPCHLVHSLPAVDGVPNKRSLVQCTTCWETLPCFRKTQAKAWSVHENTPQHMSCVAISHVLDQFDSVDVVDNENDVEEGPFTWKERQGYYFGPVCGIQYLLTCGRDNYCRLCYCRAGSIEEHFSSEGHVIRYLATKSCIDVHNIWQKSGDVRRSALSDLLAKTPLGNEKSRRLNAEALPSIVLEMSREEDLSARECLPPLMPLGVDMNCLVCEDCCLSIQVKKDDRDGGVAVWDEHVSSPAHYDYMARRATFKYYDMFFIPVMSSVKSSPTTVHGVWKDIEIDDNCSYRVQTQSDIGLEWIVEDEEAGEVVCTLCARSYKRDAHDNISNHIRSYMHFNQFLHMCNREMLSLVLVQTTEKAVQDLMLEWLQRNAKLSQPQIYDPMFMEAAAFRDNWNQIKVYSPERALSIASFGQIPSRSVSVAYCEPLMRPLITTLAPVIDIVAADGAEKECLDLREALYLSSCRIVHIDDEDSPTCHSRRMLIRCLTCQLVFSSSISTVVHDVWDVHLQSSEHDRRVAVFDSTKMDMYGFSDETSTYTVKPFMQKDPNKKVTWQWNPKEKLHDFVLSVVGLDEIVERRSQPLTGPHNPDFFCRICAVTIHRRAAPLDAHVRSAAHVMSYLHKHHPRTVFEIEGLNKDDGGKTMRRVIAQLLKDVVPPSEYCMPVYDPAGEQERKGVVAMQRALEIERQKQLTAAREKAREDRRRRDEERRLLREKELEQEKKRKEERERRDRELKERTAKLDEERNRLRQLAIEAQKKSAVAKQLAELKKKKEEEQFAQEEALRREKERVGLRAVLDQSKARVRMLQDRDKAIQLVKEKIELEKKMKELQEKSALKKQPSNVVVPDPQLIIPAKLVSRDRDAAMSSMQTSYQPQSYGSYAPNMYGQPSMVPHPNTISFTIPPPGMSNETLQMVGPKPSFSSYVPQTECIPVYPTQEEDMDVSQSRSPSPQGKKSKRSKRSRSRSKSKERDRSRRKHKKRTRSKSKSPDCVGLVAPTGLTSSAELVRPSMQGRQVDPYVCNPSIIANRKQLVDFIWRQGAERIPDNELPVVFNKKAVAIEGNVGVDSLYEVICVDSPELDTFYCSMCGEWTTPSGMFLHLATPEHKLAYLFRNYKMYHQTIMSETNSIVRESMLTQFAIQIWKMEQPPPGVSNRLRSILDRAAIFRLWPEHVNVLDVSWKNSGSTVVVPAPVSREAMGTFNNVAPQPVPVSTRSPAPGSSTAPIVIEESVPVAVALSATAKDSDKSNSPASKRKKASSPAKTTEKKSRRTPTPERKKRRSRSRDRTRRSRSRDRRSRSRDRKRSRSRSRDRRRRSRSRDRHESRRSRSPRGAEAKDEKSWMETAAAFLEQLGDHSAAEKVRQHKLSSSSTTGRPRSRTPDRTYSSSTNKPREPDFNERLAQIRSLANPASRHHTKQPECIQLDDDSASQRQPPVVKDEKVEMRKLLGVLITMQQEAERTGGIDASIVDRLYREVGLQKKEGVANDQLLAQLCSQLTGESPMDSRKTIDLSAFGISGSNTPTSAAPQQSPAQYTQPPPPASHAPQYAPQQNYARQMDYQMQQQQMQMQGSSRGNDQLEKILSGISDSMSTIRRERPPSPIMKPRSFAISRAEEFFGDTGVSYVYPEPESRNTPEKVHPSAALNYQQAPTQQNQPYQSVQKPVMSTAPAPQPSQSAEQDAAAQAAQAKREKAALRKKMLLEQAERLRKQAEAAMNDDDGDDDWDSLETEMTQILEKPPPTAKPAVVETARIGVPNKWAQPVPQPKKQDAPSTPTHANSKATTPSPVSTSTATPVPIAPGQKMALARTMLPNGKLPPGMVQTPQSVAAVPQNDPDIQIISSSPAPQTKQTQSSSVASAWANAAQHPPGVSSSVPSATGQQPLPSSSAYASQVPQQQTTYQQPTAYTYTTQQPAAYGYNQQQQAYVHQQQQFQQPAQGYVQPGYQQPAQGYAQPGYPMMAANPYNVAPPANGAVPQQQPQPQQQFYGQQYYQGNGY